MGRTTGWTIGEITESCADVNFSDPDIGNATYVCQELTNYYSGNGDSGSPVHASPYGWPEVRLYGIHWGSFPTGDQERIFSRITGIQEDLGYMIAAGEEPTLFVNIVGPTAIYDYGSYTYDAVTKYENGSVSYQWSIKWEGSPT